MRKFSFLIFVVILIVIISLSIYFLFFFSTSQKSNPDNSNIVAEPSVNNSQTGYLSELSKYQYLLATKFKGYEVKNDEIIGNFQIKNNKEQKFLIFKNGYALNLDYLPTNNVISSLGENRNSKSLDNTNEVKNYLENIKNKNVVLVINTGSEQKTTTYLQKLYECNKNYIANYKNNSNNLKCTPYSFMIRNYE